MADQSTPKAAPRYQNLTAVLQAATSQIAAQKGKKFTRTIMVTEAIADISIREDCVRIHPGYATEGNPVNTCIHILELCEEFDSRKEMWRRDKIRELRNRITDDLRLLSNLAENQVVQETVKEALGL